jgi:uncharacterized membrane-anchored protein YitT (DUF2179 family)
VSTQILKHSAFEDTFGIFSGSILVAVGIVMLKDAQLLTGGVAGLALMISKSIDQPIGIIFLLLGIPFLLLALFKRGKIFTIRSILNLAFVAFLIEITPRIISFKPTNSIGTAILANMLLGVGMLVLFRHNSSLGGFNVIALIIQDTFKIQAGYVQFGLDLIVLMVGLAHYSVTLVLVSLVGDLFLNLVLALNHRDDRYLGRS